jgi:signal transduction histidine kinase
MEINLQTVFNVLRTSPGNLVYYLILSFSIVTCFIAILNGYRVGRYPYPSRTFTGIAILIAALILPAVSIPLNLSSNSGYMWIYPILERTSLSLMLIWIAWMWLAPHPSLTFDISSILLSIIITSILFVSVIFMPVKDSSFNASQSDFIWHIVIILCALVFTVILTLRETPAKGYGIGMMALMLTGFTLSLIFINPDGDISGAARFGILCAFPLLLVLALRQELLVPAVKSVPTFDSILTQAVVQSPPDQINDWMEAAGNSDVLRQQEEFARILCQNLNAMACVFLQQSERPGIIKLQSGYNLTIKSWIEPKDLSSDGIPKTTEIIKNDVPSVIQKSTSSTSETARFSSWLGLDDVGSMAVIPIHDAARQWGAAVLFRPTGISSFNENEILPFTRISASLTNIFKNSETLKKEKQGISQLTKEISSLQEKNQKLQTNLDEIRLSAVQVWPEQDLSQVLSLQQASQSEIDRIRAENRLLLQSLAEEREIHKTEAGGSFTAIIENELATARKDLTHLQNLLNESHNQVEVMEKRTSFSASSIDRLRKFNSLTNDIRNPVSAITGYVDILLSEDENQGEKPDHQATLENLKISLARLRQIMNELAEINVLQSGVIDMEPEPMDLGSAIDQAIVQISPSLTKKNISLKLNLPESLPTMQTYHEALQKVIIHLVHNAGKVTPTYGTVELRVNIHQESSEPYLLLEITDSGGGIAPEDLKQVLLPADQRNGLIKGLGETGNGLSTSKTLIESHGGRMWVDSNPGIGTTFSVLLPIETRNAHNGLKTL